MKLSVFALLFVAATSTSFAQAGQQTLSPNTGSQPDVQILQPKGSARALPDHASQAGCPVMLTSASLASKAHTQLTSGGMATDSDTGGIDLRFRNMSGKQIESLHVTARVKVKQSVYDLDATTLELHFTISGTGVVDRSSELLRSIPMQATLFGVGQVTLEQVSYADGSVWIAGHHDVCRTNGASGLRQVEAK
jgi:hypothetical protein